MMRDEVIVGFTACMVHVCIYEQWYLVPSEHSRSHKDIGSIHDMAFMTMKYKADLFYSQGKYLEAIILFKELVDMVPKENSCVVRELRDALARSYLQVGDAEAAKKEVLQLVRSQVYTFSWSALFRSIFLMRTRCCY